MLPAGHTWVQIHAISVLGVLKVTAARRGLLPLPEIQLVQTESSLQATVADGDWMGLTLCNEWLLQRHAV